MVEFGLRFSSVLQIYLFIFVFALRLLRFFSFFDALKIYANTLAESIKFAYLSICFACFLPARLLFAVLCLLLPEYFNYFEPSRVCPKLFKLDLHSGSRRPETKTKNWAKDEDYTRCSSHLCCVRVRVRVAKHCERRSLINKDAIQLGSLRYIKGSRSCFSSIHLHLYLSSSLRCPKGDQILNRHCPQCAVCSLCSLFSCLHKN